MKKLFTKIFYFFVGIVMLLQDMFFWVIDNPRTAAKIAAYTILAIGGCVAFYYGYTLLYAICG